MPLLSQKLLNLIWWVQHLVK